jgi:uncharacterized protein (TIGR03032 family)
MSQDVAALQPPAADPSTAPLRSLHTASFPAILDRLGISLLVTTYQAGKLVALRSDHGVLNTHFRNFLKPMGLAVQGPRLAIGTRTEVWEYHSNPAAAAKVERPKKEESGIRSQESGVGEQGTEAGGQKSEVGSQRPAVAADARPASDSSTPSPALDSRPSTLDPPRCDCCFMPRVGHVTGDMQIHEMAWVDGELTFVNTLFSCLAQRSPQYSFVPTWQPPFIDALAPEDRCHLNGLGVREGKIRYVTALGTTNVRGGWRANKKDGGVLMEVPSGEVLLDGISMPHSPRWYDGRMWLLESGTGSIGTVDLAARRYQPIAEVPGFTRGLDFAGPVAFIGLSQVRESATFGGLPLTERLQERTCGVWAVNIHSGQTLGWVKFEDAVQEIFAVSVLPRTRWPDLVNHDLDLLAGSFVLPDDALQRVPQGYRGPPRAN